MRQAHRQADEITRPGLHLAAIQQQATRLTHYAFNAAPHAPYKQFMERLASFKAEIAARQGLSGAVVELEQFSVIGRNPNKSSAK